MSAKLKALKNAAKQEAADEIRKMKEKADAEVGEVEQEAEPEDEVEQEAGDSEVEQEAGTAMRPTATGSPRSRRKPGEKGKWVMPEKKAKPPKAPKVKGEKKGKRLSEEQLIVRYPHVRKGTMKFDPDHNKMSVEAKLECGHVGRVYTSDLFQVKRCPDCRKAASKEKLAALKANDKKTKKVVRKKG